MSKDFFDTDYTIKVDTNLPNESIGIVIIHKGQYMSIAHKDGEDIVEEFKLLLKKAEKLDE